jgi:two-component system C4-dicarboxylate transport response regulator DctD
MRTLVLENRSLRAELTGKTGLDATIIGNSPLMEQMREMIRALANANANVLINGETGTGKELVARCLHDTSDRAKHNFVPVNCGAIPREMFESELFGHEAGAFTGAVKQRIGRLEFAHQGTLFLDEIESMPVDLQVKLLRVLDHGKIERLGRNEPIDVDFRVVAATKINLQEAAQADDFREDLYFRLNVAEVHIPPLRDRPEDVPLLFEYFARHLAVYHNRDVPDLSRDDLNDLMSHSWPGNVRELRNVVERHVLGLGGDTSNMATLIEAGSPTFVDLADRVAAFEKSVIEQTLAEAKGNIQEAMTALGMARRTLNEKMRKYSLDRKNYV